MKLGLISWKLGFRVKTLLFQTLYFYQYNPAVDLGIQNFMLPSILGSVTGPSALYPDSICVLGCSVVPDSLPPRGP